MKHKYSYMAGLIDGDGNIGLSFTSKNKQFRPRVRLMLHSNLSLEELFGAEGFYVYKSKKATTIQLKDYDVIPFLKKILPYLILKKERATLLIEAMSLFPGRGKRWQERNLNKLIEIYVHLKSLSVRQKPTKLSAEEIKNLFLFG